VCDGVSTVTSQAYVALDWAVITAAALRTFYRQIHGGLFNLEAGQDGPEYASGAFRARFHYYKPTQLLVSTWQQGHFFEFKDSKVAPEARMFLRTEPSLLGRFIDNLPALDAAHGGQALLECIAIST
jgi:hypothetical protein